jgi:hypothetical protein
LTGDLRHSPLNLERTGLEGSLEEVNATSTTTARKRDLVRQEAGCSLTPTLNRVLDETCRCASTVRITSPLPAEAASASRIIALTVSSFRSARRQRAHDPALGLIS